MSDKPTTPMFILPGEDLDEYMTLLRQKGAALDFEVLHEQMAEAMFKVDEKHGPIRVNIPYGSLKSFQRVQYERYADAAMESLFALIGAARPGYGCPHAGAFQYCETCTVSPCPIGLGGERRDGE